MFVSFKYYVYLRWPSAETTCQTSGRIFNSMRKKLTSLGSPLAITDDDISRILCLPLEVVLKDLLGASGITSLSVEAEEVTLGVMQEVTVRLRELRSLGVKGRFLFGYSLSYSVCLCFSFIPIGHEED